MNKNFRNVTSLLTCAFALSSAVKSHAAEYAVTIQTSPLATSALSANGPFSLDIQLNYGGSGFGNSATINNFVFGGGSASGSPILSGIAAGSLSSTVTLTGNSTSQFNDFNQTFNPGTALSFDVNLSDNPTGVTPDGLAIAILDNTGGQIVTTDPDEGLSLATFEIGSFGRITTATYAGIDNTDPSNLVNLGDYTGVTVSVTSVPEPSALAPLACLLAPGLLVINSRLKRRTA